MNSTSSLSFLIPFAAIYLFNYFYYLLISRNHLDSKAIKLQLRRSLPSSIFASLPFYLLNESLFSIEYFPILLPSLLNSITFPTLYHVTNRQTKVNYTYHYDFIFGISLIAWLTSLLFLLAITPLPLIFSNILLTLLSFAFCLLPIFEIAYYLTYKECINLSGIFALVQTDYNEALSFLLEIKAKVFTLFITLTFLLFFLFKTSLTFSITKLPNPSSSLVTYGSSILSLTTLSLLALTFITSSIYLWNKPQKGVFSKTSIIKLYLAVKDYFIQTELYTKNHKALLKTAKDFEIPPITNKPQTIILVIGESASRDYINAFSNCKRQTSPWLSKEKDTDNFILFPNSYSSWHQTVKTLEKSLTEDNQYNDKKFNNSYSIIDIAKAAGYKTTWFSNQGHIGANDTAISLIAETADTVAWTEQKLGCAVHDEELLPYLKKVNPKENNLIVLHLMGSHGPYLLRYPKEKTIWEASTKINQIDSYDNSLAYTDSLLQHIQEYSSKHLNLQFMLYFSDHAAIPDKLRSPSFKGFGMVRIPMFIYLSDNYIKSHKKIVLTLKNNKNKYFTNDLIYDFFCGLLDVKSKHFNPENSITSKNYKYNASNLRTNLGKTPLGKDTLNVKNEVIKINA